MMETAEVASFPVKSPVTPFDGVAYLKKNLSRQPGDTLKVTRVGGHSYRVNWYSPDKSGLEGLVVMRNRKSQFIVLSGEGENVQMTVLDRQ